MKVIRLNRREIDDRSSKLTSNFSCSVLKEINPPPGYFPNTLPWPLEAFAFLLSPSFDSEQCNRRHINNVRADLNESLIFHPADEDSCTGWFRYEQFPADYPLLKIFCILMANVAECRKSTNWSEHRGTCDESLIPAGSFCTAASPPSASRKFYFHERN